MNKSSYQVLKEKYEKLNNYVIELQNFIISSGDKDLVNKFYGRFYLKFRNFN